MPTPSFKLLSDAWKQSRKASLFSSLKSIKPLQHLSHDAIAAIVETASFHAFDVGDIICQQVRLLRAMRAILFFHISGFARGKLGTVSSAWNTEA
jgi:hypothetical protein